MNCIKEEMIQRYIDGETSPAESGNIKKHLLICKSCMSRVEKQRELASALKKSLQLSEINSDEVPVFELREKLTGKRYFTGKRIFYYVAAACTSVLLLFLIPKKKNAQHQNGVEISLGLGVDANRPVSQLPVTLRIIDENGKVTEY